MKEYAKEIATLMSDYHSHHGFSMTPTTVLTWVKQFDEADQEFILKEFLYILNQGVYIRKESVPEILINQLKDLAKLYKYKSVTEFLLNASYIQTQTEGKSQSDLIEILKVALLENYGFNFDDCGSESCTHFIYLDDIIATGRTLHDDLYDWFDKKKLKQIVAEEISLDICVLCCHNWNTTLFRLSEDLHEKSLLYLVLIHSYYPIVNVPWFDKQAFNLAYPIKENSEVVNTYFEELKTRTDSKKEKFAFRDPKLPKKEILFSSPDNRNRFEKIILEKGIEILSNAHELSTNHRPLGATYPSYRTLGTGTLFFTWRNISNTCPVVFWWGAHWFPLFPLYKRGL